MKKFITSILLLSVVFACFYLAGCGVKHGAKAVYGTFNEEWRLNNLTYNSYNPLIEDYDTTSPGSRQFVITDRAALEELYLQPPEIDFEKHILIVYCYTSVYSREFVLKRVEVEKGVLKIVFNVKDAEMRGCERVGDAHAPGTAILAVRLNKVEFNSLSVTYLSH